MRRKSKPQFVKVEDTLLIEGLPDNVKPNFKAACARRKTTMREAIIQFMRDYAKEIIP